MFVCIDGCNYVCFIYVCIVSIYVCFPVDRPESQGSSESMTLADLTLNDILDGSSSSSSLIMEASLTRTGQLKVKISDPSNQKDKQLVIEP